MDQLDYATSHSTKKPRDVVVQTSPKGDGPTERENTSRCCCRVAVRRKGKPVRGGKSSDRHVSVTCSFYRIKIEETGYWKERGRKLGGRYGREPSGARNEKRVFQVLRNPLFSLLRTRLQNRRLGTGFFSSGLSRLGIWFRRRRGRSGWVSNVGGPNRCDPPEEDSGSGYGLVAEDDLPHAEGLDRRLGSSSGSEKRR
ncbi:uncharacterized protein LOC131256705 isoform X2 [Magnolia sinica]|uniref:uncharacterized protein LOC131256705 isoform X2 n=1 Tax=Magnolia sinica TaxID=86752 RepID=UPI002658F7C2|nr:uncharacterized protein LOC131256705 isoform X2 [Magnolia sinica]